MLARRDRIEISQSPISWRKRVSELSIEEVAVSGDIGILAAELENFHADPADRIIAATGLAHGATLVTADARILGWTGSMARHNARR